MRKVYEKPVIEVELYQLSQSIATACATVVSLGPGGTYGNTTYEVCSEYEVDTGSRSSASAASTEVYEGTFYNSDICSCYHSLGDGTLTYSY